MINIAMLMIIPIAGMALRRRQNAIQLVELKTKFKDHLAQQLERSTKALTSLRERATFSVDLENENTPIEIFNANNDLTQFLVAHEYRYLRHINNFYRRLHEQVELIDSISDIAKITKLSLCIKHYEGILTGLYFENQEFNYTYLKNALLQKTECIDARQTATNQALIDSCTDSIEHIEIFLKHYRILINSLLIENGVENIYWLRLIIFNTIHDRNIECHKKLNRTRCLIESLKQTLTTSNNEVFSVELARARSLLVLTSLKLFRLHISKKFMRHELEYNENLIERFEEITEVYEKLHTSRYPVGAIVEKDIWYEHTIFYIPEALLTDIKSQSEIFQISLYCQSEIEQYCTTEDPHNKSGLPPPPPVPLLLFGASAEATQVNEPPPIPPRPKGYPKRLYPA